VLFVQPPEMLTEGIARLALAWAEPSRAIGPVQNNGNRRSDPQNWT
jgi:hypothetical protein